MLLSRSFFAAWRVVTAPDCTKLKTIKIIVFSYKPIKWIYTSRHARERRDLKMSVRALYLPARRLAVRRRGGADIADAVCDISFWLLRTSVHLLTRRRVRQRAALRARAQRRHGPFGQNRIALGQQMAAQDRSHALAVACFQCLDHGFVIADRAVPLYRLEVGPKPQGLQPPVHRYIGLPQVRITRGVVDL